jgi:hypothetical protein
MCATLLPNINFGLKYLLEHIFLLDFLKDVKEFDPSVKLSAQCVGNFQTRIDIGPGDICTQKLNFCCFSEKAV